ANVLIDRTGKPLLSDFGLAKSAGDSIAGLTATGSVMGTPAYMSPEQAMGQRLDGRSDQYSLGIIAFQLVAGVVPFTADSPLVVLNKHLQEAPPRPSKLNPKLSPAVDQTIEKALRKNSAERYVHCEEFSQALARAFGLSREVEQATSRWESAKPIVPPSPPIEVRERSLPPTMVTPPPPRRSRRGAIAAAAGVLAVALLLLWRFGLSTRPRPSEIATVPVPRATVAVSVVQNTPEAPTPSPAVASPSPAPQPVIVPPTQAPRPTRPKKTATAAPAPTASPTTAAKLEPTVGQTQTKPVSGTLWTSFFEAGQKAFNAGDFRGAEKLFRDAVSEAERFGQADPRLARSVQRLGVTLGNLGRLPESEVLLRRSMGMWEKQADSFSMDLADSEINLGSVLTREGKAGVGEAEQLIQRGLAAKEKSLGARDPAVASALQHLAFCYEMQSRHADAEPLLRRALNIYEAAPGAHEPARAAVLNDLGWLLVRKGEPKQAEAPLREALAVRERVLPANHPALAQTLMNLAQAESAQKKDAEAEELLKRALAIREKSLGPDSLGVAQTLDELAKVARALGHPRQADQFAARAKAIRSKNQ
ncbi:MAG TPA: serine/threonine-protein kinase, partial [Thermoanaerobaculia bacterium]